MRILCYILVVLFVTTTAVGQQINPVPDYIFRNSMSVGRNAPTDTAAYFSIGPRFGATRGFMPPMVVDTAAVTGTKRNGLLIYSIQRNSFLYWDSTGNRWSRLASLSDTITLSTRAWRQKGIDSVASVRIGGSGVTGYIPKFTAARTLDSSQIFQLGGNIGFGTATPSSLYKIDVSGAIRATQANNAFVQIQSTQGNAYFQVQDSASRWQIGGSSNSPFPNGVFYIFDAKNNVGRLNIDHLGRTALGSHAPAAKLDMRQSGVVDLVMVSTTSGTQENTIQSYASNGAIWSNLDIRSNNLKLFTTTIGGTQAERMRIFENGRIGVNTSVDAGFQFDVNGTARTGTLTVNTNGQGRTISTNQASGTDGSNIFIGGAGASINGTSGTQSSYNTSLGSNALVALTTGNSNTSIGFESMQANTTGSGNTAFGRNALRANTTANSNTSIGNTSMQLNTTGASNTAIGVSALSTNTTGSSNVAIGVTALGNNTTANNNVAIGFESMLSNSTGVSNTAIGTNSLRANTTANSNTAIGLNAMYFNTTGASNVAVGIAAMQENTTGGNNSAFGSYALISNKTGSNNTAIGFEAGRYINSGGNNDTANNSIYIGYDARSSANNRTNEVVIGYQGRGNGSNTVTIGNSSTTDNYFFGALLTSAPPGGTANAWRLGTVATVTPTSPNRTIEVSIGGTIYYIHAKTTND